MAWEVILLYIIWLAYATLEGFREGFYFHFKDVSTSTINVADIHPFFATQRLIVGAVISLLADSWLFHSWINTGLFFASLGLAFTFFHDGMYYVIRNRLNKSLYPKGWFDQSTTSTALTDKLKLLTPIKRTIYFLISIGILIYTL